MTKMLLNVYDNGLFYIVNNAFTAESYVQTYTNNIVVIEISDTLLYANIVDAIASSKTVKIPKNIMPIGVGDLIIDIPDELTAAKLSAEIKIKNFVNDRVGNSNSYDFYRFNVLNNQLSESGYVITESNKETQYLAILETADDALIASLQEFLEAQNKVGINYALYTQAEVALIDIADAITVLDVDTALNTFTAQFN